MNTSLDIAKNYSQFIESKLLAHPEWSEWIDLHSQHEVDQLFINKLFEEHLTADFKNNWLDSLFNNNSKKVFSLLMSLDNFTVLNISRSDLDTQK